MDSLARLFILPDSALISFTVSTFLRMLGLAFPAASIPATSKITFGIAGFPPGPDNRAASAMIFFAAATILSVLNVPSPIFSHRSSFFPLAA